LVWQHEKKTYDILVKQLGEDDSRTRDSQNWMNTFKMREVQVYILPNGIHQFIYSTSLVGKKKENITVIGGRRKRWSVFAYIRAIFCVRSG